MAKKTNPKRRAASGSWQKKADAPPARFESAGAALALMMTTLISAAGVEAALLARVPHASWAAGLPHTVITLLPFLPAPVVLLAGSVLVGVERARVGLHIGLWFFAAAQLGLATDMALQARESSPAHAAFAVGFVAINVLGIAIVRAPGFRNFVAAQDGKRRARYPVGYGVGVIGGVSAFFAAPFAASVVLLDLHHVGGPALFVPSVAWRPSRAFDVNPWVLAGVPIALGVLVWANRSRTPLRVYLAAVSLVSAGSLPFAMRTSVDDAILSLIALGIAVTGLVAAFRPGFDEFWKTEGK